jgi:hypothetical protein
VWLVHLSFIQGCSPLGRCSINSVTKESTRRRRGEIDKPPDAGHTGENPGAAQESSPTP